MTIVYERVYWPVCFQKCGPHGPKIYLASGVTNEKKLAGSEDQTHERDGAD
jgi:hypothetical protein